MLLGESDGIAFDDGVLEELGIVVDGEVSAIVGAATLFAGQCGTSYQQAKGVQILRLVRPSGLRMGHSWSKTAQVLDGRFQSGSSAHNTNIPPHKILNFADNFLARSVDRAVRDSAVGSGDTGRWVS